MRFLTLLIIGLLFYGCGSSALQKQKAVDDLINSNQIFKHLSYLASDSLKGRNTPSPELDSAASYIASEFSRYGVRPVNNTYFQSVNFGIVSLGSQNSLKILKHGKETAFNIKTDFVPFEMTASKSITSEVVFAGYGITAPEYNYDDYKDIDVTGKIVFILRHEPGENDTASIFNGIKPTEYSDNQEKVKNALKHGAAGIMIATDPVNHSSLTPRGFPWPSLSRIIPKDALPLLLISKNFDNVPVIHAGESIIKELFGSVDSLKSIQNKIDGDLKPQSFPVRGLTVAMQTSTEIDHKRANNVIGYIEGSNPELKNELVIIGAHYDHVGTKKEYLQGEDYIFNGADDNASGTSALLTIASAFGSLEEKPGRSILFIAFCGEEKGLYGSEYYVDNPLFPLEKTVAMLNLDMIGRNSPDSLEISGYSRCPELKDINDKINQKIGFSFNYTEQHLAQSDHANFLRQDVPALFYCSGEHQDYHKVTDHTEKINLEKTAKVAKLAFLTAEYIANDTNHYRVLSKIITLF